MADTPRTTQSIDGNFRITYLDDKSVDYVMNLINPSIKVAELVEYSKNLAKEIRFPVLFSLEQGFSQGSVDEDLLAYADAQTAYMPEGKARAQQMVLKSVLSINAAKASNVDQASFRTETKFLVSNMVISYKIRREIIHWYGKEGLAIVESVSDSGADAVVVLTKKSFAPGIWIGQENCRVDFLLSDKSNFAASGLRNVKVKSIDIDTRTIVVEGVTHSDIAAGQHIYFGKNSENGAGTFVSAGVREMRGIKNILTYSGSDLFGLSTVTYGLWKGTTADAQGDKLSFELVQQLAAKGAPKGLVGKVHGICNVYQWADLMNDEAGARRYDKSYSHEKLENGTQKIVFFASNSTIEIMSHGPIKGEDFFILKFSDFARSGADEMSFETPSPDGTSKIFVPLTTVTGVMLALWGNEVLYCLKPAAQVYAYNLDHSVVGS